MQNTTSLTDGARAACLHLKGSIEAIENLPGASPIAREMLGDALMDLLTDYNLLTDPAFDVQIED